MEIVELSDTRSVWNRNEVVVCPVGTVAEAGTPAMFGAEVDNWITAPPIGAGPLIVGRQVIVDPPLADAGQVSPVMAMGSRFNTTVRPMPS